MVQEYLGKCTPVDADRTVVTEREQSPVTVDVACVICVYDAFEKYCDDNPLCEFMEGEKQCVQCKQMQKNKTCGKVCLLMPLHLFVSLLTLLSRFHLSSLDWLSRSLHCTSSIMKPCLLRNAMSS